MVISSLFLYESASGTFNLAGMCLKVTPVIFLESLFHEADWRSVISPMSTQGDGALFKAVRW